MAALCHGNFLQHALKQKSNIWNFDEFFMWFLKKISKFSGTIGMDLSVGNQQGIV